MYCINDIAARIPTADPAQRDPGHLRIVRNMVNSTAEPTNVVRTEFSTPDPRRYYFGTRADGGGIGFVMLKSDESDLH